MIDRALPRSVEGLTRFASEVLATQGVPGELARTAAEHMLWADARGTETHGLVRLPLYVRRMQTGLLDPKAEPRLEQRSPAAALVDGGNGLGHPPADYAMDAAITRSRDFGIGITTVRHSGHFGAAGAYAAKAAEEGVIGIVLSNAAAVMAPTGGTERKVGNNPLSIAAPFEEFPIVFDIAMSAVAAWSLRLAANRGESIPPEWGLDSEGVPTTDPVEVMDRGGLLRPLGDHKGYGLAVMVDLLTGVLSGGGFGVAVKRLQDEAPVNAAHTCIAVDIEAFMPHQEFAAGTRELVESLRATPLARGAAEILVPGEREARVAAQREKTGIPYPVDIFTDLETLAAETGVALPEPVPAAENPVGVN